MNLKKFNELVDVLTLIHDVKSHHVNAVILLFDDALLLLLVGCWKS